MTSPRSRRLLALAVVPAALTWAVAWGFIGETRDGSVAALGLDRGAWHAVLTPAIAVILAAVMAWAAHRRGPAAATLVVGIGAMLAGNLLAFGLVGQGTPVAQVGGTILLVGAAATAIAPGLLIGGAIRRATGRGVSGVAIGAAAVPVLAIIALAVPAAASLALFALVDALLQPASAAERATPAGALATA